MYSRIKNEIYFCYITKINTTIMEDIKAIIDAAGKQFEDQMAAQARVAAKHTWDKVAAITLSKLANLSRLASTDTFQQQHEMSVKRVSFRDGKGPTRANYQKKKTSMFRPKRSEPMQTSVTDVCIGSETSVSETGPTSTSSDDVESPVEPNIIKIQTPLQSTNKPKIIPIIPAIKAVSPLPTINPSADILKVHS
jgi:hypothetical protein